MTWRSAACVRHGTHTQQDGEQEARIALLREYSANGRNWYTVLLTSAIVLFTAVQVKADLEAWHVWEAVLLLVFWQMLYAIIRAAVSIKLAQLVVGVRIHPIPAYMTCLEVLRDEVERALENEGAFWRLGLRLGDSVQLWVSWTAIVVAGWTIWMYWSLDMPLGVAASSVATFALVVCFLMQTRKRG